MKVLIIYDSAYGNTAQIAMAIGNAISSKEDVSILKVSDVKPDQLAGSKLIIVGSPTQRFRPTIAISDLLNEIPENKLKGVKVAAFDTRLTKSNIDETPVLAFFVKLAGQSAYAARHIVDGLRKKGGELIGTPEGFFVERTEGPLINGELERAADWAKHIISISMDD